MNSLLGKYLIVIGIIIVIIGVLVSLSDVFPILKYLGRLPGDIYIKRDNFTFYFPITTSILISVIISMVFFLIGKIKS